MAEIETRNWKTPFLKEVGKGLVSLGNTLSIFFGFSVVAYLIAWVYTGAYLSAFDAKWILHDLGPFVLVQFAWFPLFLVLGAILAVLLDFLIPEKFPAAYSVFFAHHKKFLAGFIVVVLAGSLLKRFSDILDFLTLAFIWLYISGAVHMILLASQESFSKKFGLNPHEFRLRIAYVLAVFALVLLPWNAGSSKGKADFENHRLNLPKVTLLTESQKSVYSLLFRGESGGLYLAKYDSLGSYRGIRIADQSSIELVQGR